MGAAVLTLPPMYIHNVYTEFAMTKAYRAKIFKSGNSITLRMPKALGLEEGTEMIGREERGEFRFEPVDKPKARIHVSGSWGTAPGPKLAPDRKKPRQNSRP